MDFSSNVILHDTHTLYLWLPDTSGSRVLLKKLTTTVWFWLMVKQLTSTNALLQTTPGCHFEETKMYFISKETETCMISATQGLPKALIKISG